MASIRAYGDAGGADVESEHARKGGGGGMGASPAVNSVRCLNAVAILKRSLSVLSVSTFSLILGAFVSDAAEAQGARDTTGLAEGAGTGM